jgi:hypothetical protein
MAHFGAEFVNSGDLRPSSRRGSNGERAAGILIPSRSIFIARLLPNDLDLHEPVPEALASYWTRRGVLRARQSNQVGTDEVGEDRRARCPPDGRRVERNSASIRFPLQGEAVALADRRVVTHGRGPFCAKIADLSYSTFRRPPSSTSSGNSIRKSDPGRTQRPHHQPCKQESLATSMSHFGAEFLNSGD